MSEVTPELFQVRPIERFDYDAVLDYLCREFLVGSVLHRSHGVTREAYVNYMREPFCAMVDEGFSVVALDQQSRLRGCLLASDYALHTVQGAPAPEPFRPVNALLNALEALFEYDRSIGPGQVLKVDMAVVSPSARRQGIYQKLRQYVHSLGAESAYSSIVGELTSKATQTLCIQKFGHELRCEIDYASFEFEGGYPFASIESPKSVQLVEGDLRTTMNIT